MRLSWIAAPCLICATPAAANPYDLDDMLAVQSYGKAIFDPDGKWAVVERYRPYENGAAYHFDAFNKRILGEIMRVDLITGGSARPLFPQSAQAGYWVGSESPDGKHLTVFRLMSDRLSLGIVDMMTSDVHWLPLNPVAALLNPVPIWRDNRRLLVLASRSQTLAYPLDAGSRSQRELALYWQRSAGGQEAGVSVIDSSQITADSRRAQHDIVEVDIVSYTQRRIAEGHVTDMALSANSKWLAITEELADAQPVRETLIPSSARPREHSIRVIALDNNRSMRVCTKCETMPGVMHWADEENSLLFFAREPGEVWEDGRLHVFETRGEYAKPLRTPQVQPWLPDDDSGARIVRAGWHGREVLMLSRTKDGMPQWVVLGQKMAEALALPCQSPQIFEKDDDLFIPCPNELWHVHGRQHSRITVAGTFGINQPAQETFDTGIRYRYAAISPAAGKSVWSQQHNGGLVARSLDESGAPELALPENTSRLLGIATTMRSGLAVSRSDHGTSRLWLLREHEKPSQIDAINTHLEDAELPTTVALPGDTPGFVHWLFLPQRSRPGQGLPLVIMPYPGAVYPHDRSAPMAPDSVASAVNPLIMTGLGYAVLLPSLPHDRAAGEPSATLTHQIEAAADAAIASGYVDAARMAVYGHSFGGYTALVVASRSKRFKAFVAGASAPDLTLQHGHFLPYDRINLAEGFPLGPSFGWAEHGQARLKASPWQDPDRYVRNSPYYRIDAIQSPVLLIHGDLDPVSMLGAERMFSGLYRSGGNVALLRYWGEGHTIRSPSNIRDMWRYLAGWLSLRLGTNHNDMLLPDQDVVP